MPLLASLTLDNKWPGRLSECKRIVDYAQTFLSSGRTPTVDMANELLLIQRYWLDACADKAEAAMDECSVAELLFWTYCLVYCCCEDQLRQLLPLELLYPLNMQLSVAASAHKSKFLQPYALTVVQCPGQDLFWAALIGWITQHCSEGLHTLLSKVDKLPVFNKSQLSKDVVDSWEHLQADPKPIVQSKHTDRDQDDQKQPAVDAEADLGYVFRLAKSEAAVRILPIACRTAAQIEVERSVLNACPIRRLNFTSQSYLRMHQWLVEMSKLEANDTFGRNFREFVYELNLPMGARMRPKRKVMTASNNDSASTLIHQELGPRLFTELEQQLVELQYLKLSEDEDHVMHGCYLICRFAYAFVQKLRVDFFKHFWISPSRLIWEKSRFFKQTSFYNIKPSPIVTRLGGVFYVHDLAMWYKCANAYEALMAWLWLSKTNHNNCTDTMIKLQSVEEDFHPELDAS